MAINKVVYDGKTLIDLTDSTVSTTSLAEGATAYNASGMKVTGTMPTSVVLYDKSQSLTEVQKAQARENIGAQATGECAFYVTITGADGVYTADKTVAEIYEAWGANRAMYCDCTYSENGFFGSNIILNPILVMEDGAMFGAYDGAEFLVAMVMADGAFVSYTKMPTMEDIPTTLPNPNALTFTGAATGSYDGSTAKTVNIPAVKGETIHYVVGTGTTEGTWLGTCADITKYYDGLCIAYKIGIAGVSGGTTLNINNLGAVAVRKGTSATTTHLPVNTVVHMTYTTIDGVGYWVWADYDSGNTKVTQTQSSTATGKYPVLLSYYTQDKTTTTAQTVRRDNNFHYQASTGTLTVSEVAGNAATASKVKNALTFTGAATGTYDGSKATTINIPTIAGSPGYTPVRGTDYWTEADKEAIVQDVLDALGGAPFYGTVDENNVITVTTSLAEGTYILKYEHADGSTTEVGQIVISEGGSGGGGGVAYVDLADHTSSDWLTNKRINSSKNVVDVAESVRGDKTVVVTNFIDISGVSKLHIKGLDIVSNLSGTTNYGRVYLYQGTTVSEVTYQPSSGLASNGKIHYSTADYDSSVTVFDIATMLKEWGKTSTTHVRLGGILTGAATDVIITADEKIQ